jgi:pilus assembly protein CpaE
VDAVGLKRERVLFIMNRFDKKITITPERVGESLRQPVVTAIPFDEKFVSSSVNRGIPFMVDNKNQPIGKNIQTLADLVKEKIVKLESPEDEIIGKK